MKTLMVIAKKTKVQLVAMFLTAGFLAGALAYSESMAKKAHATTEDCEQYYNQAKRYVSAGWANIPQQQANALASIAYTQIYSACKNLNR